MLNKLILIIFCLIFQAQLLSFKVNHEGAYAWYTYNEGPTGNKCSNINQCDGQRTCSRFGWCTGTSRPPKNANYFYNEAVTGNKCPTSSSNPNWANKNYYCDGLRTCSSFGWCSGVSR
jgi:hypothetical protein